MSARDETLARLRATRREDELPPPWAPPQPTLQETEALAETFATALTAALGEVHRCASLAEARRRLGDLLHGLEAKVVAVNGDAPLSPDTAETWGEEFELYWPGGDDSSWRELCARADVGISGAEAALADTGSVLVASGPEQSRLATLLPPVHVAFLPLARLEPDLFAWAAARGAESAGRHANAVFVSGPSKSADIEQTMAVGVHGPGRFIVLLYGGEST